MKQNLTNLDLQLCAADSIASPRVPRAATVNYVGTIDPCLVPLHVIAGPALQVYTGNEDTETWILSRLLSDLPSNGDTAFSSTWQSGAAALLKVNEQRNGQADGQADGPEITELLLFASRSGSSASKDAAMLTPPRSSSPDITEEPVPFEGGSFAARIKIFALPLSSGIGYHAASLPDPPTPPPEAPLEEEVGMFLPLDAAILNDPRKRKRLDSLFEDATKKIKRAKRRGGETVAKIMAKLERPATSSSEMSQIAEKSHPEMLVRKRPKGPAGAHLARSQSIGSLRDLANSRPVSRGDPPANGHRSSLSRVATTGQLGSPALEGPGSTVEQQNRNALSRIVMAGMRIYGLSQKKKEGRSGAFSEVQPPNAESQASPVEEEDEYKAVYHQTYKAAVFAIRRQIGSKALSQEVLRDVVDRILAIFCVDPFEDTGLDQAILPNRDHFESAFGPPSQEARLQSYGASNMGGHGSDA